jgi:Protein of unknown function (DUF1580)
MPIDLTRESPIPLSHARSHIPGRPHISTLHRWSQGPGVRGRKLETFLAGGRRFTTLEAIQRFLCTDNYSADRAVTDRQRQKLVDAAAAELDRVLGVTPAPAGTEFRTRK